MPEPKEKPDRGRTGRANDDDSRDQTTAHNVAPTDRKRKAVEHIEDSPLAEVIAKARRALARRWGWGRRHG